MNRVAKILSHFLFLLLSRSCSTLVTLPWRDLMKIKKMTSNQIESGLYFNGENYPSVLHYILGVTCDVYKSQLAFKFFRRNKKDNHRN